jgi:hypothetical protein
MKTVAVKFGGLNSISSSVLDLIVNRDEAVSFHEAIEAVGYALGVAATVRAGLGGTDVATFQEHFEVGSKRGADAAASAVFEQWIETNGGRQ